ncbi:unnamed protein product [Brassica oleracea]
MEVASEGSNLMEKVMYPDVQMCTIDQQAHCGDLTPKEFKELLTSGMQDPAIQNILTNPVLRR